MFCTNRECRLDYRPAYRQGKTKTKTLKRSQSRLPALTFARSHTFLLSSRFFKKVGGGMMTVILGEGSRVLLPSAQLMENGPTADEVQFLDHDGTVVAIFFRADVTIAAHEHDAVARRALEAM